MFFNKKLKNAKELRESYQSEGEDDDNQESDKDKKESDFGLKRPRSQVDDDLNDTPNTPTPDKV